MAWPLEGAVCASWRTVASGGATWPGKTGGGNGGTTGNGGAGGNGFGLLGLGNGSPGQNNQHRLTPANTGGDGGGGYEAAGP